MDLTPSTVAEQREWILDRTGVVVPLINHVRTDLGTAFETDVDPVTERDYREAVRTVFVDGDRAVNVAALVGILRTLDVENDYPGFVVDEMLGRKLAGTIAGAQPLGTLGEATFHYADVLSDGDADDVAGLDDLDAALAAGFQTRLPGWGWQSRPSPFSIERDEP